MEGETYILAEDKYSSFKKGFLYAKKGDKVKEITRTGDVAIVEDKKGERFSINIKQLI